MKAYMVGLPSQNKGIEDFYYLATNITNIDFFWFCGAVDPETVARYGDKINFQVGLARDEIFRKIADMQIHCNCSYYESFSLPIAEALILRKPVITYNIDEVHKAFKETIQYVPYRNKASFLKIVESFRDTGGYSGNPKMGYELVQSEYSPAVVAKKLMDIF